jgi:hypothetical protein
LHRLRNTLRNKVFGIRSGTVLIPRSGYDELLGALVNSLLHQPERKSST